MALPPWQKERAWIGAEGVARKIRRNNQQRKAPDHVGDVVHSPEWKGSTITYEGRGKNQILVLTHPSGAVARLRVTPE